MSGVFNTAVIPSLAILFARNADGSKVDHITLDRKNLIRDVFWVVLSDIALIGMIFYGYISVWLAVVLNLIYVGYAVNLWIDAKKNRENVVEDYEDEQLEDRGVFGNIITFNFNKLFFKGEPLNTRSALVLIAIAVVIITAGSHIMVEGVIGSSEILGIPNFISGLILGAAASSIPDLILSLKDARKGEYEDAVANPLASNTFDTSISVGLPLLIWLLWQGQAGIDLVAENMEALRISVVAMSAAVGISLIYKYQKVAKTTACFILGMYLVWCGWIAVTYA